MPGPFFYFVVLIGLATLAAAVAFVRQPTERNLATLRPLCAATAFSGLAAFLMGMANGLAGLATWLERGASPASTPQFWPTFARALAESPAPLIIACAVLTVTWLLAAVGLRRQV